MIQFRTVKLPIQPNWKETFQHWAAELRSGIGDLFKETEISSPVGSIVLYTNEVVPEGWLRCDGSILSKTAYSNLYNVIKGRFGAETPTTFTIPDMRGQVPGGITPETPGLDIPGMTTDILGIPAGSVQSILLFNFIIRY